MTAAERRERIVKLAQRNPDAILADLAFACDRSEAWTQKVLQEAGITPPGAKAATPGRKSDATPCRCGHRRDEHCADPCKHWRPWRLVLNYAHPGFLKKIMLPELKANSHCLICGCFRFENLQKANLTTRCANPECGHHKNDHCWTQGKRKHGTGVHTSHFSLWDWSESGWYQCISNHCTAGHYEKGVSIPCACSEYLDPYAKAKKRKGLPPAPPVSAQSELELEEAED